MKRTLHYLALLLTVLSSPVVFSQCPAGDVTITNQADIDNFGTTYPACTTISGVLTVSGSDITNLNGFANITTVTDYIDFSSTPLLTSLSGFNNLTSAGGFYLYFETALSDLSALGNLSTITAISPLGGNVQFYGNDNMPNITLPALTSVPGFVDITLNSGLTTLSFPALTSIGGSFSVSSNPFLPQMSFNSLASTGYFYIENNNSLTDLSGFSSIATINTYIDISNNPILANISGLSNLTTLNGYIQIDNNPALTSLSGLDNLNPLTLTGINIRNNATLSVCNTAPICALLGGACLSDIHTNAPGLRKCCGYFDSLQYTMPNKRNTFYASRS
ncbi:hypothetical protein [Flavobacterium sp. 3HN19-14]|uniref:hypothetical protein n=1 Tax=Flavobacterium sp. 3HN19-14 TaxID=3448133 RepID=UPI003EE37355